MGKERIAQFADCLGLLPASMVVSAVSNAHGWLPIVIGPGFLLPGGFWPGGIARDSDERIGAERPAGAEFDQRQQQHDRQAGRKATSEFARRSHCASTHSYCAMTKCRSASRKISQQNLW
jgi:hypothetical protein